MWEPFSGMMGGWGGWGWLGPFHFVIPLLSWALIITAIVLLIRYTTGWSPHPSHSERRSSALDVLEQRYARGEISREEFVEKKRDIAG